MYTLENVDNVQIPNHKNFFGALSRLFLYTMYTPSIMIWTATNTEINIPILGADVDTTIVLDQYYTAGSRGVSTYFVIAYQADCPIDHPLLPLQPAVGSSGAACNRGLRHLSGCVPRLARCLQCVG